jgi:enediyne biosynthesis protein E4
MRAINKGAYKKMIFWMISCAFFSCDDHKEKKYGSLFKELNSDQTNINFQNTLTSTNEFNIYKYRNFYNGGGVGLGDINNDGLLDIYLVANMGPNKLYLNKGDFVFEDITESAGVEGKQEWSTGVSMVDINGDGWLDIYVCNSGDVDGNNRKNEFFINNGNGTFTDMAEEMGLADNGYSTHAVFFDYDKDGDLDMYQLNNSFKSIGSFNLKQNERDIRDSLGGDKLYRNNNGIFVDVSKEAGIYGSVIGFGLGVSVSDLDKDGWQDLYISNDFFERDYIYMNNGDGTFREVLEQQMRSISVASMGSDIADLNGDGYPEIFVTEMLPQGDERFKTTMTFESWDKYIFNLENDYYHQFTRNMLHRHNGISSVKGVTFSEIGRLSGVEATDWSWSALIADLDNDGYKDLYITNGIAQDILNQDYLSYVANEEVARMVISEKGVDFKQLIDIIPVTRIPNYAYSGSSNLLFLDKTQEWGLGTPSHSNGSAYGDLNNDGYLDLVVNNVNMPVFIYQNQGGSLHMENNYLKIVLEGEKENKAAIGTKVTLISGDRVFYLEQSPNRGFQSSVDNRLNFGLGNINILDSIIVDWYYGKQTIMTDVEVNQTLVLRELEAKGIQKKVNANIRPSKEIFKEVSQISGIDFIHKENEFSDFNRDRLIYHMKSTEGPKIAIADVNGDGSDDFYVGGAKDSPGKLFIQNKDGSFKSTNEAIFEMDKGSEDLQSIFFDVDMDGDLDLYVTSGGSEFSSVSMALIDRLYLNDGKGNYIKSSQMLPTGSPESSSTIIANDFDGDGDMDLFVGIRLKAGAIGIPQNGYLLENDGKGNFKNVTSEIAPELLNIGMISDAVWADYDGDGDDDLMIVGEWMSIRLFNNDNGIFKEVTSQIGLNNTFGWWNTIQAKDLNGDGHVDYVLGNHGLNSRFRTSKEKPITCYINDFDQNGSIEQILSSYIGEKSYPMSLRHDLVSQLPHLKKKYLKYEDYQGQTINDVFTKEELEVSIKQKVTMLESVILWNNGNGTFKVEILPLEAQLSPIFAILLEDIDNDGIVDILLGGNLHSVKPEVGRYDASYGVFMKGLGKGKFDVIPTKDSGLLLEGEVRDFGWIHANGKNILMVVRNNAPMQYFEF